MNQPIVQKAWHTIGWFKAREIFLKGKWYGKKNIGYKSQNGKTGKENHTAYKAAGRSERLVWGITRGAEGRG